MKNNDLSKYINTLKDHIIYPENLIDAEKILKNTEMIEADLNSLNYLICNDEKEFEKRVKRLHEINKNCFKSIFIIFALRTDVPFLIKLNDSQLNHNEIIDNPSYIYLLFKESGVLKLIIENKIKNFVDYVYGIEVGMDTNARKNRNGKLIENEIFEKLKDIFKKEQHIKISKQITFKELKKQIDFVIENNATNQQFLIESSFYNTQGSKINETAKSYNSLNKMINDNATNNQHFIWLADGKGMKQIEELLEDYYQENYILNHELFFEKIYEMVMKKNK